VRSVSLSDIADGAADLALDPSGPVLVAVDLDSGWAYADAAAARLDRHRSCLVVGVSGRELPPTGAPLLERLTLTLAPGGPGRCWAGSPDDLARIAEVVAHAPVAALTLGGVLEATSRATVRDGLTIESLAYSTLLAGAEFARWRAATAKRPVPDDAEPVVLSRDGDTLSIALNRPHRHNAFSSSLRDGLLDALDVAEADPTIRRVVVTGNGPSFCSGGDLDEFGDSRDPAAAHQVRTARSAGYAVHRLASRTTVRLHGACIGAGIEVPAFAGRVKARDDAFFRLPELGMGLVPGAGGTVSVTRRIGRWRTAYLALTDRPVDVPTALRWGLVDERDR
jgi:hypothetical protein